MGRFCLWMQFVKRARIILPRLSIFLILLFSSISFFDLKIYIFILLIFYEISFFSEEKSGFRRGWKQRNQGYDNNRIKLSLIIWTSLASSVTSVTLYINLRAISDGNLHTERRSVIVLYSTSAKTKFPILLKKELIITVKSPGKKIVRIMGVFFGKK